MGHGSKQMLHCWTGRGFLADSGVQGKGLREPKAKAPNLFIEQQYGDSLAIPHYPQQVNFP